jgi:hypothetical protein
MVLSSTDRYPRFRMTTIIWSKVGNGVGNEVEMDPRVDIRVDIRVYTRVDMDMADSAAGMDMVDSAVGMVEMADSAVGMVDMVDSAVGMVENAVGMVDSAVEMDMVLDSSSLHVWPCLPSSGCCWMRHVRYGAQKSRLIQV